MTTWLRVREQFHSNLLGQRVASGESNVTDFLSKLVSFSTVRERPPCARSNHSLESAFDPQADISARRRGHVIEHGWR
jgi:DHA2 family multidrug resistance protein